MKIVCGRWPRGYAPSSSKADLKISLRSPSRCRSGARQWRSVLPSSCAIAQSWSTGYALLKSRERWAREVGEGRFTPGRSRDWNPRDTSRQQTDHRENMTIAHKPGFRESWSIGPLSTRKERLSGHDCRSIPLHAKDIGDRNRCGAGQSARRCILWCIGMSPRWGISNSSLRFPVMNFSWWIIVSMVNR